MNGLESLTERVAAGASFLDDHDPGWWRDDVPNAINLAELDLAEPDLCVLGQRCPLPLLAKHLGIDVGDVAPEDYLPYAYRVYAEHLSGITGDEDRRRLVAWGDAYGFSNSAGWDAYPSLTAEWRRVIEARRAAVAAEMQP